MAAADTGLIDRLMQLPTLQAGVWLLICATIFTALAQLTPHDRAQPIVRKDAWLDAFYWLIGPAVYASISSAIVVAGFWLIFAGDVDAIVHYAAHGADWAQSMPLWMQMILVLIISDIYMYWCHRLFHGNALWRFHAIHHSAEDLDWLHGVRFHPVNYIPHAIVSSALMMWIGFAPAALLALGPFNYLYSCMVHANLNWTFGPFKYVFASPVFHRWHHTGPDEGGSSNFAPTFPLLDVIFGTFYMPEGVRPGKTGLVEQDLPPRLGAHLLYPFRNTEKVTSSMTPEAGLGAAD
jgi:sterol desaturase/sphingolipid hydroxylase (fatty acid hydroxylase superfamily)